jgi:uncharacterized protein YjbJ (UPF0337 family)
MAFGSFGSVWLATSPYLAPWRRRQANADDGKGEAKEQATRHHGGRRRRRSGARDGAVGHGAYSRPDKGGQVKQRNRKWRQMSARFVRPGSRLHHAGALLAYATACDWHGGRGPSANFSDAGVD